MADERIRNNDGACPPVPAIKPAPVIVPQRPAPKCDPAPEPVPEVYFRPVPAAPVAVPVTKIPRPYPVPSRDQLVRCADFPELGPVGDSVFVAGGEYTAPLEWKLVPDISPSQLNWIAERSDDELAFLASDPSALELTGLKLTNPQAAWVQEAIEVLQGQADATALAAAQSQLECVWISTEQRAECPAGAITTPGTETSPVINPSISPAGSFRSTVSQADADQQGLAAARAELGCVWLSAPITVTCLDAGFTEEVPVEPEGTTNRRIGVITLAAGAIESTDSQEDADAQARALALGSLICNYPNTPITVSCLALGKVGTHDFGPADLVTGKLGSTVTVPAGSVISALSTADADAQAYAQALLYLRCEWLSAAYTAYCLPQLVDLNTSRERYIDPAPEPISGRVSSSLPFGAFSSTIDQADADNQAVVATLANLECKYCNDVVQPVCLPANFVPGTLPIPAEAIDSTWSADATPGTPAGAFCFDDAQLAVDLAESTGSTPIISVPTGLRCVYVNDEIRAGCIINTADGILGLFDPETGAQLSSELSTPDPHAAIATDRYRVVAAGTIRHSADRTPVEWEPDSVNRHKTYANELARRFAFSFLRCQFGNAARTFTCAADKLKAGVHSSSTDNVVVRANLFTSLTSQEEADATAVAFGQNSLNCFYLNPRSRFLCAPGFNTNAYPTSWTLSSGTRVYGNGTMRRTGEFGGIAGAVTVSAESIGAAGKPVEFSEGVYQSYVSQEDVDLQMRAGALTQMTCHFRNTTISVRCGASTNVLSPTTSTSGGKTYGTGIIGTAVHASANGSASKPIVVSANVYSSSESPEAADKLALLQGLNSLNCFFMNNAGTATCAKAASDHFHPNAVTTAAIVANRFSSTTSQAEADAIALLVAKSALRCSFGNDSTNADPCPDDTKPTGLTSINANFVEDFNSTAKANQTAKTMANALRACASTAAPGGDGAQTSCSGQCYGYYS